MSGIEPHAPRPNHEAKKPRRRGPAGSGVETGSGEGFRFGDQLQGREVIQRQTLHLPRVLVEHSEAGHFLNWAVNKLLDSLKI